MANVKSLTLALLISASTFTVLGPFAQASNWLAASFTVLVIVLVRFFAKNKGFEWYTQHASTELLKRLDFEFNEYTHASKTFEASSPSKDKEAIKTSQKMLRKRTSTENKYLHIGETRQALDLIKRASKSSPPEVQGRLQAHQDRIQALAKIVKKYKPANLDGLIERFEKAKAGRNAAVKDNSEVRSPKTERALRESETRFRAAKAKLLTTMKILEEFKQYRPEYWQFCHLFLQPVSLRFDLLPATHINHEKELEFGEAKVRGAEGQVSHVYAYTKYIGKRLASKLSAVHLFQRVLADPAHRPEYNCYGEDGNGHPVIILRFASQVKTALEWLESNPTPSERMSICSQLFDAVAKLHIQCATHGNLELESILLDEGQQLFLSNFDAATVSWFPTEGPTRFDDGTREFDIEKVAEVVLHVFTETNPALDTGLLKAVKDFSSQMKKHEYGLSLENFKVIFTELCNEHQLFPEEPTVVSAVEEDKKQCIICFDDVLPGECVQCTARDPHAICKDCFQELVAHLGEDELELQKRKCGRVVCPVPECESGPYADVTVACVVNQGTFDEYIGIRNKLIEAQLVQEMELSFKDRLAADLARHAELTEEQRNVRAAARHILEEILTTKCPVCRLAFLDWDGCMALKCRGCRSAYCAICLADCRNDRNDAHRHAANCEYTGRSVFASNAEIEVLARNRRQQVLDEYLATLGELRDAVVALCKKNLDGLGLRA